MLKTLAAQTKPMSLHIAAFGAIVWLQEEGYIRFSEIDRQESVDDFVLASKAFSRLLKAETEEPTTSLAQKIEFARLQHDSSLLARLMRDHFLTI